MQSPEWIENLRSKWKLENAWQVIVVLLVFACTGITIMLLKRPVLKWFNTENTTTFTVAYYLLILPVYNVILLAYGFIFGQFRFFWEFEKRFINRIVSIFKNN